LTSGNPLNMEDAIFTSSSSRNIDASTPITSHSHDISLSRSVTRTYNTQKLYINYS
jgi:hypothetical protein